MSTPYPPPPRRLMRDPSHKLIGGVCSGLAKYLNMDVNLVRILTVLISLFTGIPIVLYIIALFVLPEDRPEQQPPHVTGSATTGYGSFSYEPASGQPAYGQPAQPATDPVWGAGGAPWEQPPSAAPASAPSAPSAPSSAPAQEQTWQQPAWDQRPETEATVYDTAPAEPAAPPADEASTTTEQASTGAAEPAETADQSEPRRDS